MTANNDHGEAIVNKHFHGGFFKHAGNRHHFMMGVKDF